MAAGGGGQEASACVRYRRYLHEQELSRRSVDVYARMVIRAEAWCEPHGFDLATAPAELIMEWAETEVPRSTSSRRQARSALRHYWAMAERADPPEWAVRVPKTPTYVCRALEPDEAALLAAHARARGDERGLVVLLGLYAALRASEIAAVRWGDVDDGWLKLVGKGDRPATIPLHPVIVAALDRLARADDTWVFPGRWGGPVHPTTVWTWVRAVAVEAGLAKVPTHRLRHTALATANDATGDLRAVQELARHVKPETTSRYTRVKARRLTSVVRSIDYEEGRRCT
jgi:integrase